MKTQYHTRRMQRCFSITRSKTQIPSDLPDALFPLSALSVCLSVKLICSAVQLIRQKRCISLFALTSHWISVKKRRSLATRLDNCTGKGYAACAVRSLLEAWMLSSFDKCSDWTQITLYVRAVSNELWLRQFHPSFLFSMRLLAAVARKGNSNYKCFLSWFFLQGGLL